MFLFSLVTLYNNVVSVNSKRKQTMNNIVFQHALILFYVKKNVLLVHEAFINVNITAFDKKYYCTARWNA